MQLLLAPCQVSHTFISRLSLHLPEPLCPSSQKEQQLPVLHYPLWKTQSPEAGQATQKHILLCKSEVQEKLPTTFEDLHEA